MSKNADKSQSLPGIRWILLVLLLLGAIDTWAGRKSYMVGDTASYIGMAREIANRGPAEAINGYWSPLYPLYLSLFVKPFLNDSYQEFASTRVANFLIYCLTLAAFQYFLSQVLACYRVFRESTGPRWLSPAAFAAAAYALFFWACFSMNFVCRMSPDQAVTAAFLAASGVLLSFRFGNVSTRRLALFGAVLGAGYWIKAILFPVALLFLGAMMLVPQVRATRRGILASIFVFVLIAAPLVVAVSAHTGHLTFGETGSLNYAWEIGRVPRFQWTPLPPEQGTFAHPIRRVLDSPPVFEFATPLRVAYPPWYDASYWYRGVRVGFMPVAIVKMVATNIRFLGGLLWHTRVPIVLVLIVLLAFLGGSTRAHLRELAGFFLKTPETWLISVATIALYMPFAIETRYIAGPMSVLAVLVLVSLNGLTRPISVRLGWLCAGALAVAALLPVSGRLRDAALVVVADKGSVWNDRWSVMREFQKLKIEPEAPVASIGFVAMNDWPLLSHVRVVAEAPDNTGSGKNYWLMSPEARANVLDQFRRAGAKLVVAYPIPAGVSPTGWTRIENTDYYYLML